MTGIRKKLQEVLVFKDHMATPVPAVRVLSLVNQSKQLFERKNWIRLGEIDEIIMSQQVSWTMRKDTQDWIQLTKHRHNHRHGQCRHIQTFQSSRFLSSTMKKNRVVYRVVYFIFNSVFHTDETNHALNHLLSLPPLKIVWVHKFTCGTSGLPRQKPGQIQCRHLDYGASGNSLLLLYLSKVSYAQIVNFYGN